MSDPKPHYIPHPLCRHDTKIPRDNLDNLDDYIKDSPNPRWAASHLVRSIAQGLETTDRKTADVLYEVADQLASRDQKEEQ